MCLLVALHVQAMPDPSGRQAAHKVLLQLLQHPDPDVQQLVCAVCLDSHLYQPACDAIQRQAACVHLKQQQEAMQQQQRLTHQQQEAAVKRRQHKQQQRAVTRLRAVAARRTAHEGTPTTSANGAGPAKRPFLVEPSPLDVGQWREYDKLQQQQVNEKVIMNDTCQYCFVAIM